MTQLELRSVIITPDGQQFDNKADALAHMRKPKVLAALAAINGVQAELATWLLEHREHVEMAFESGTIRRVSKTEAKKLKDALEHIKATLADDKKVAFVVDNVASIIDSFRWPSVKRMDEAEKALAARNTLLVASDGNEELADWVLANKTAVLAAYEAGVEKRAVSPKATDALAAYRAEKAKEKAILETEGQEALDAYIAQRKAAKEAAEQEAAAGL